MRGSVEGCDERCAQSEGDGGDARREEQVFGSNEVRHPIIQLSHHIVTEDGAHGQNGTVGCAHGLLSQPVVLSG